MAKKIQKKQIENGIFVETKDTYEAPVKDNDFVQKKYVDVKVDTKADKVHTHKWADITEKPEIKKVDSKYTIEGLNGEIVVPTLPAWVSDTKPTYNWSEIIDKPSLNYLPLTGGMITPTEGDYREGIRIGDKNGWSLVHLGAVNTHGTTENSWTIARKPNNSFQISNGDISNDKKKGLNLTTNTLTFSEQESNLILSADNTGILGKGFKKENSSNEKVLLGGGGEKELSELENKSIIVGGRNYVPNSKFISSKAESGGITYLGSFQLEVGKTYIISAKRITGARPDNMFYLNTKKDWDSGEAKSVAINTPFIVDKDYRYLWIWCNNIGDAVTIEELKLEKGNKATDWTPALEDFNFYKELIDFSELNTFKNRPAGSWAVRFGGGAGIYVNFPASSSASSLEFFKPNWYPATRIGVRNSVDTTRFNDDNGKFRDLAWYDDILRAGVECTQNTTLQKEHQNQTLFVTVPCNIELNVIDDLSSVSFRKVFDSGVVSFSCTGKNIIYTSDNQFNGKKGSTAVISRYGNDCYIDIRNI